MVVTAKDAWCAKVRDLNQYLQVDFLLKTRVTRVGILRRVSKEDWVTKYSLQYSDDDITWTNYVENGHIKVGENLNPADCVKMFLKCYFKAVFN